MKRLTVVTLILLLMAGVAYAKDYEVKEKRQGNTMWR